MKRLRIAIPVLVVLVLATGIMVRKLRDNADRGIIRANGTIEATETDVSPKVAGRLVDLLVDEGDHVKAGQVIARLDTAELQAQVVQAEGNLAAAKARYADLQAGSRPEQVAQARAYLLQVQAGAAGAQDALANAELAYRRSTQLRGGVDAAEAERDAAAAALQAAQARLAELKAGARTQEVTTAEAAVQQAQAAVAGARKSRQNAQQLYDDRTREKQQVDSAETALQVATARQAAAVAQLGQAEAVKDQAALDARRLRQLVASGAAPQAEVDAAETRLKTSTAAVDSARQAVNQANDTVAGAQKGVANAKDVYKQRAAAKDRVDLAQAQYDTAAAKLEAAQAQLSLVKEGARSEDIQQAQAAVLQAQARSDGAVRAVRNAKELYADRIALKQQLDQARAAANMAEDQVRAAQSQLDLLLAGATKDALQAARAQTEQAAGAVEFARAQLADATIHAPISGVVTVKVSERGEMLAPGTPIVTIADLVDIYLRAFLPLPMIGKVKLGQACDVTADSYPGKRYAGRISYVSDEPEFTPKNVQTHEERVKLVFSVKVTVRNHRGELKPGMPADMRLNLSDSRGVRRKRTSRMAASE